MKTEYTCPKCKITKPVGEFYKSGRGFSYWCKECVKSQRKERTASGYDKERRARLRAANPPKGRSIQTPPQKLASQLFDNTKKRSERKGAPFDLTREWVTIQVEEFCRTHYTSFGKRDPFQPSIDRINGSLSYIRSNVRVVWLIENYARNGFSDEQVIEFCKRKLALLWPVKSAGKKAEREREHNTMTYTVISRDPNSWTRTAQGDFHEITFDCGHHHRTLTGAVRCLQTLDGTTASINAQVETAAKNQKYDGERVERDSAYDAALQTV